LRRHQFHSCSIISKHLPIFDTRVHYRFHKDHLVVPILNPVHNTPSYFSMIHFNIMLTPSSSGLTFFRLSHQNPVCIPVNFHACYIFYPYHTPWLHNSDYIWEGVEVMKPIIMQFSSPSRHFIPLWSTYSPQHPALSYPQSEFYIYYRRPCKCTGKIMIS
jgi:hypothetical protein